MTLAVMVALQAAFSGCVLADRDHARHERHEEPEEHEDHEHHS